MIINHFYLYSHFTYLHIHSGSYSLDTQCVWHLLSIGNAKAGGLWRSCAQSRLTLCDPMDCRPLGSSVHGIFWARTLQWVAISFSGGPSWPRDWACVSCISCTARWILYHCNLWEARFQNTRVGCRFLFQGIFPTQESNPGLPHCRWILYQLSHQGSPIILGNCPQNAHWLWT